MSRLMGTPHRWRTAGAGLVAGMLVGVTAAVVVPAIAAEDVIHAATSWKKVWKKHLRKYADKRYYTKSQSDERYAAAGSSYSVAQSDARYYTKAEIDARLASLVNSVSAYADGAQNITLTDEVVVRSVSLVAPADGKVIVTSSGYFVNENGGPTTLRCKISTGTTIEPDRTFLQFAQFPGAGGSEVIGGTRGFDVTKGSLLTVNLVCDQFIGAGSVRDTALTAVFAPS
ncbi:hypothetical protein [Nocardioides bigeumensis]